MPSLKKLMFNILTPDGVETVQLEAEGTMPDTEEGHDDRSISKQYYTRSQRQGSHNDVQGGFLISNFIEKLVIDNNVNMFSNYLTDSSGKSFWGNMLEWQVIQCIKVCCHF